jgi:two-component system nitrogen regulation response regulator NtrX
VANPAADDFILVVDDDIADLIGDILRLEGYRVRVATDGEAALREIERGRPSLVITDVRHPGPTGHDLLAHCQLGPDPIPVLLTSAWRDDRASVGVPFLPKPFLIEDLLAAVARLIAWPATGNDASDQDPAYPDWSAR